MTLGQQKIHKKTADVRRFHLPSLSRDFSFDSLILVFLHQMLEADERILHARTFEKLQGLVQLALFEMIEYIICHDSVSFITRMNTISTDEPFAHVIQLSQIN